MPVDFAMSDPVATGSQAVVMVNAYTNISPGSSIQVADGAVYGPPHVSSFGNTSELERS